MRVRVAYSRCQNLLSKGLFVDFLEKLKVKEELVCWPIWRKILAEQSFIILEIENDTSKLPLLFLSKKTLLNPLPDELIRIRI